MGLFEFFKKGPSKTDDHQPVKEISAESTKNFLKDNAGLYPYEILMLSYFEKYADGKEPARFWEREYGINNVYAVMDSLEKRGFASNGKLTELGKNELNKNEYVLYIHRHKHFGITMSQMSILVNRNPNKNYRDLIWGEFNKSLVLQMKNRQFGLYRNTKYAMYRFLLEEKKYEDAMRLLAEVFFYDLNGSDSPFIAKSLINDLRELEIKIDYTEKKLVETLQSLFKKIYSPYKNYSINEVVSIIVSYCFGHDELAEKIIAKRKYR